MTSPEKPESSKALEKAADAIESAAYNLKGGFISATANRAYYSCYYCMIALLYTKDLCQKTSRSACKVFRAIY